MGWAYTSTEDTSMTLVLGMYNEDSVTVVSDGLSRMFDPDTGIEQDPITDTQKVFKLNDGIVIGYSNSGVSYDFIRGLMGAIRITLQNEINLQTVAEQISGIVQNWNLMFDENPKAWYRILIAGIDPAANENRPDLWVVGKSGEYGQSIVNWTAIGDDKIANPIYKRLTNNGRKLTSKEALDIGAETLFETAQKSEWVGGIFSYYYVDKNGVKGPVELLSYNKDMSKKLFKELIKRVSTPVPVELDPQLHPESYYGKRTRQHRTVSTSVKQRGKSHQ